MTNPRHLVYQVVKSLQMLKGVELVDQSVDSLILN